MILEVLLSLWSYISIVPIDVWGLCGVVRYFKRLRRHVADRSTFILIGFLWNPRDAVVKAGEAEISELGRSEKVSIKRKEEVRGKNVNWNCSARSKEMTFHYSKQRHQTGFLILYDQTVNQFTEKMNGIQQAWSSVNASPWHWDRSPAAHC